MRDYRYIDRYLNELLVDIYEQPPDPGHQAAIEEVITKWIPPLQILSVLDVGCGQGQAMPVLKNFVKRVAGVTLGSDIHVCEEQGLEVYSFDMSFLPFADGEFEMIFSRHSLEHSPMPLLSLMEWHRVASKWLLLIVPNPNYFAPGGRNHYYVMSSEMWKPLIERAGWIIFAEDESNPMEYRYLCRK